MKFLYLYIVIFLVSCTTTPPKRVLKSKQEALIKSNIQLDWADDMDYQGLAEGIMANIQHLKTKPNHTLQFGDYKASANDYALELTKLYDALKSSKNDFINYLKNNYSTYQVYGKSKPGEAFVTSYFAPEIKGSMKKTKIFTEPLYAVPDDMVIVRLDKFAKAYGDSFYNRFCKNKNNCQAPRKLGILRARRVNKKDALMDIEPYFSRQEIQKNKVEAKVLAWVDPIDSFFMQIQGSGFVKLANGERMQLGYAGQNGHRYEAIGKYLFDVIPKEKMSLQTIEEHLKTLTPEKRDALLAKNPSFVFFKEIATKPVTYFGIETIDGRTIATDKRYFPKGALGFLSFKKPVFASNTKNEPESWQQVSRFVFDHDTGGAIKGGGRLDLYWGSGASAKQSAGVMKNLGDLVYLFPKNLEVKVKHKVQLP